MASRETGGGGTGAGRGRPPFAPSGVPAAAAAKKKTSSMAFLPTIPTNTAKASATGTAGGSGAAARVQGMRPIGRATGAPPGQFRNTTRGGGGGGAKQGMGRAGFMPRQPMWVPVGSTTAAASAKSGAATSGEAGGAATMSISGEMKNEGFLEEERQGPVARQAKQYAQEDIAPTAQSMQINPLDLKHPLTLPFLDPAKANPTLQHLAPEALSKLHSEASPPQDDSHMAIDGLSHAQIQAASLSGSVRTMGIQAEIANPAHMMFKADDGDYRGDDQLFFIQMPSAIPIGHVPSRPSTPLEHAQVLGFKGNLTSLPSGNIGQIVVFKSGKVKMKVGDLFFDVSTGMACNFLQEVVAIDTDHKKLFQLGDIQRRMVCYPDIALLLDSSSPPSH